MIIQNEREKLIAQQSRLGRVGFTLMEILVVVAIIVALAGVGGYYLIGQLHSSQIDVARLKAKEVQKACKTFFIEYQRWPQNLEELYKTPNGIPKLEDPKAIYDPWGQQFQMTQGSYGPVIGTTYNGQVITSND